MKTIKFLLTLALSLIALGASAQFSVKAGYTNVIWKTIDGNTSLNESLNGFGVGVAYEIALPVKGLSIRPGVNYTLSGYKSQTSTPVFRNMNGLQYTATTEHALSIPADVMYAFKVNDSFRVYAFAGPSLSVGLDFNLSQSMQFESGFSGIRIMTEHDWYSGKGTTQTSISQYPEGIDYDWDTNDSDSNLGRYSRWDVAMRLGAGVQYKRVFLEFEYNFGLLNRTTKDLPTQLGETRSGWDKTRRDELALSLGLTF